MSAERRSSRSRSKVGTDAIFRVMDDQWRTGKELAQMAGVEVRTGGQRCMVLVREGVAEYTETLSPHRNRRYRRAY